MEIVQLDGELVLDIEAKLAAPFDKGAAGHAQFGGDADETPALGAALDEFLTGFRRMHNCDVCHVIRNAPSDPGR